MAYRSADATSVNVKGRTVHFVLHQPSKVVPPLEVLSLAMTAA